MNKSQHDIQLLAPLVQLREEAGLTQAEVGRFFGNTSQRPDKRVMQWELGKTTPPKTLREKFIQYLANELALRARKEQFKDLWHKIMVGLWEWEPLTRLEEVDIWGSSTHHNHRPDRPNLAPPKPPRLLVGREALIKEVLRKLSAHKTVALHGWPGVGKTAVTIETAHDPLTNQLFPDGVLWVGLGQNSNVLARLAEWGQAVGLPAHELAKHDTIETRANLIHTAIGNRRMLLIIDDAWDTQQAKAFRLGSKCAHLLTTRSPEVAVQFAEEAIVTIPELSTETSLQLLHRLAPKVVQANEALVERLLSLIGGLPLSLVLIGNYLRSSAITHKAEALSQLLADLQASEKRFKLAKPQGALEKHPSLALDIPLTLQNVIELSFQKLDPSQKQALCALAIFPPKPNSFSPEAAAVIADVEQRVIKALVDIGLVEKHRDGRCTIHQTIVEYARFQPANSSSSLRFVAYFRDFIKENGRNHAQLEPEIDNIMAALDEALNQENIDAFIEMANYFSSYLELRGLYQMAHDRLNQARQLAQTLDNEQLLATTLSKLGRLMWNLGERAQAEEMFRQGLTIAYHLEEYQLLLDYLNDLAIFFGNLGEYDTASQYAKDGLEVAEEFNAKEMKMRLLLTLSNIAYEQAQFGKAEDFLTAGLELAEALEQDVIESRILLNLGVFATNKGRENVAARRFRESLKLAKKQNHLELICTIIANQAELATVQKDFQQAEKLLQEAVKLLNDFQPERPESTALVMRIYGTWAAESGHFDWAEQCFQKAEAMALKTTYPWDMCDLLIRRANMAIQKKAFAQASKDLHEALQTTKSENYLLALHAEALFALAQLCYQTGEYQKAQTYAQTSLPIYENAQHRKVKQVQQLLLELKNI